jgi:hypothetical protein
VKSVSFSGKREKIYGQIWSLLLGRGFLDKEKEEGVSSLFLSQKGCPEVPPRGRQIEKE